MHYASFVTDVVQIGPMACPTLAVQKAIQETKSSNSSLIPVLIEVSESFWKLIKSQADPDGRKGTAQHFRIFGIMSKVNYDMLGPAFRVSFSK